MKTTLTIEDRKLFIDMLDTLMNNPHCEWYRERCVCLFCMESDYSGYHYIKHSETCPTLKFGDLHNKLYEDIWEDES